MGQKNSVEITFEGAMERLEGIVEAMESGELALETMLERYEEGTRLVKLCSEKLAAAEKRIEIITRNAAGKPQAAEFDPAAPPASPAEPVAPPARTSASKKTVASDDVSLF